MASKPLNREKTGDIVTGATMFQVDVGREYFPKLNHATRVGRKALEELSSLTHEQLSDKNPTQEQIKKSSKALSKVSLQKKIIEETLQEMQSKIGIEKKVIELYPMPFQTEIASVLQSKDTILKIAETAVKRTATDRSVHGILPSSVVINQDIIKPVLTNLGINVDEDAISKRIFDNVFDSFNIEEVYHLYRIKGENIDVPGFFRATNYQFLDTLYNTFPGMFYRGQAVGATESLIGDLRGLREGRGHKMLAAIEIFEKRTGDVLRTSRPRMSVGFKNGMRPLEKDIVYNRHDRNQYLIENHYLMMKDTKENLSEKLTRYAKVAFLDAIDEFGFATLEDADMTYYYNMIPDASAAFGKGAEITPKEPKQIINDLLNEGYIRRLERFEYRDLRVRDNVKYAYVFRDEIPSVNSVMDLISGDFPKEE